MPRRSSLSFSAILISMGVLLLVGYFGYQAFANLPVEPLNEPFPTVVPPTAVPTAAPAVDSEPTAEPAEAGTQPEPTAAPQTEPILLLRGEFYNVEHEGHGIAAIYQLPDGSLILRFEDFEVLEGPELHVYLTSVDPIEFTVGIDLPDYVDLGLLKSNRGSQNYELPSNIDLSQVNSVVIWCQPYLVAFNAAAMHAP